MSKYIIGIDTGGTFTDIAVITQEGQLYVNKVPTTPGEFSRGVINSLSKISEDIGISLESLLRDSLMLKHGNTVATNAMITGEGSKVGLITTKGFEDTTLIMRAIGRVAGLSEEQIKHQAVANKPEPIVPKDLIKGVTERIDFRGNVVVGINEEEAEEAVRSLIEEHRVEAIAVNFLFSFMNPKHELFIEQKIKEIYGNEVEIFLTYAHKLVPVIREYARSNTVIINAFLDKTVRSYISDLEIELIEKGYKRTLFLMQSNGGIVHPKELTAIGTLQSGPCGGMIASKYMAENLGHSQVITTDMGGTSFDVGLISEGYWHYMRETVVERFHISWPMIDIESIGAGGGTIAWIDRLTSRLRVGPKSAAANPGPVCYDLGGSEPTVTDANLLLGYLDPGHFLGGRMPLNKLKAEKAMEERIAKPLGMDVVEAAAGIYEIVNNHMADLIRKKIFSHGHLPKEFVIYAFGGAGPVHAAAFGYNLGVDKIYVFPTSAVFSAFGISAADLIHTYTTTYRLKMPLNPDLLNEKLEEVEDSLLNKMEREGIDKENVYFRRTFYMRYMRQLNEIEVQVPTKVYEQDDIHLIMDEFERRYEEVYGKGSSYREAGIEIISICVDAIGKTWKPELKTYPFGKTISADRALKGRRNVYFPGTGDFVLTKIYDYTRLEPGNRVEGPSIIETPITTIVVPPGTTADVDNYLAVEISLKGEG